MQRILYGWKVVTAVSIPPVILLVLITAGFWYQYQAIADLQQQLQHAQAETASTTAQLDSSVGILADRIASLDSRTDNLANSLQRIDAIESQLGGITGTVSTLEKLTRLDPELLQKYSKVFFLNENYTPSRVSEIPVKYLSDENRVHQIHSEVLPFLSEMIEEAKDDGIELRIASGYRSFDEQHNIKTAYTITYGAGTANTFSADQGYSEHQLGTAVDFSTPELNGSLSGFGNTDAYQWLLENAKDYGFVLSYPEENEYYLFEPWHWRFVGTQLARDLYLGGNHFYNLDQRTIDEYLPTIFE